MSKLTWQERSLPCEYRSLEVPLPNAATRSNNQQQEYQATGIVSYIDPVKRRNSSTAPHHGVNSLATGYLAEQSNNTAVAPPQFPSRNDPLVPFRNAPSTGPQQLDADSGFEEVNRETHGTEYYGPVSLFSFLRRLRSRAHTQRLRTTEKPETATRNARDARDMSIVNLLHSSDFPLTSPDSGNNVAELGRPPTLHQPLPSHQPNPSPTQFAFPRPSSLAPTSAFPRLSNQDIERECVRLYFLNLHIVHPILDQIRFLERCETEVWSRNQSQEPADTVFLALFNAILAVGAIQAGEDASFMRDTTTVRQAERYAGGPDRKAPTYPPLKLAKLFFERAKTNLGDVFEACSLESTQTLMLMVCAFDLRGYIC
jgi:hypothetical protein